MFVSCGSGGFGAESCAMRPRIRGVGACTDRSGFRDVSCFVWCKGQRAVELPCRVRTAVPVQRHKRLCTDCLLVLTRREQRLPDGQVGRGESPFRESPGEFRCDGTAKGLSHCSGKPEWGRGNRPKVLDLATIAGKPASLCSATRRSPDRLPRGGGRRGHAGAAVWTAPLRR